MDLLLEDQAAAAVFHHHTAVGRSSQDLHLMKHDCFWHSPFCSMISSYTLCIISFHTAILMPRKLDTNASQHKVSSDMNRPCHNCCCRHPLQAHHPLTQGRFARLFVRKNRWPRNPLECSTIVGENAASWGIPPLDPYQCGAPTITRQTYTTNTNSMPSLPGRWEHCSVSSAPSASRSTWASLM